MRCANCGNELKAGSLYCDVCGHPVQIVPDYNEFDDYLDNLVGNDERRTDGQKTAKPVSDMTIRFDEPVREQLHSAGQRNGQKPDRMSQSVKQQVRQAQTGEQQSQTKQPCEKPQSDGQRAKRAQQKKIIIISAVVCAVAIVILIAAITRNVSRSHDNSFDYQVKQAKAESLPSVAVVAENHLFGPYTQDLIPKDCNVNVWFVGIGVKFSLGSLWKNKHHIRKARTEHRQSKEALALAREGVENAVQANYINLLTSYTEVKTQQKQVELANQNYSMVQNRYQNDLALLTDMVDASNMKLSAEMALVNARISMLYNFYTLKYVTNTL